MSAQTVEKQWIAAAEGDCPDVPNELLETLYPEIWAYGPNGAQVTEIADKLAVSLKNGYPTRMVMQLEDMNRLGLLTVTSSHVFLQSGWQLFGDGKAFERVNQNLDSLVYQSTKDGHECDDTELNRAILMCLRLISLHVLSPAPGREILHNRWASEINTFLETL